MKRGLILLISSCNVFTVFQISYDHSLRTYQHYSPQAMTWAKLYYESAPDKDIINTLNYVFLALKRSQETITTQDAMEAAIVALTETHYEFTKGRLHPSHFVSHIHPESLPELLSEADNASESYAEICRAYHFASKHIALGSVLINERSKKGLANLRDRKVKVVADGLATIGVSSYETTVDALHAQLEDNTKDSKDNSFDDLISKFDIGQPEIEKKRYPYTNILKPILSWLLTTFNHYFSATDTTYSELYNDTIKKMYKVTSVQNAIWRVTEEIRSSFLFAHYLELYNLAIQRGIDSEKICLIVSEQGVQPNRCLSQLPDPISIVQSIILKNPQENDANL